LLKSSYHYLKAQKPEVKGQIKGYLLAADGILFFMVTPPPAIALDP
jgi:hypothetical protein